MVPVPGSRVGSFMSLQDANNRFLSHGLGSDLRGTLKSGSVEGPSSRTGRDDADVAEALSVCNFPNRSAPGSPGEISP